MEKLVGVLLVEPDEELAHWLGRLIQKTDGFSLSGFCADAGDIEGIAAQLQPDLIILDSQASTQLDPGKLASLHRRLPGLVVIITGLENGVKYEGFARDLGADGFLCKSRLPQFLASMRDGDHSGI